MTPILARIAAIFIAAFFWAKMEVEIEGEHGWAKNLPTWRLEKHVLLDLFLGGRPLTGFHLWAFTFVGFAFHFPILWQWSWSWPMELEALGSMLVFWVIEDFLWFMANPHYGWKRYGEKSVKWHPRWIFGFPADHWGMLLLGLSLLVWSRAK